MARSIGETVNSALKVIGEPEVSSFTSGNILEETLIEEANIAIRDILARHRFEWGLKHTTLTTTDDVSTGSVKVTNGSTTVESVDSDGDAATNFTNLTTSMWFRRTSDQTSYQIASISLASGAHALTLSNSYKGTTSTATGYRCFQDTYSITDSDLDEIQFMTYGDATTWWQGLSGYNADRGVHKRNFADLMQMSGGDLHRDSSGRPAFYSLISVDSSDDPQIVLWPFPTDDYLMDVWYSVLYSENSTFSTNMFSGDAPAIAYDLVGHRVKSRAYRWDEMPAQAAEEMRLYEQGIGILSKRENDYHRDQSIKVETYRANVRGRMPVRSSWYFDHKAAQR